MGYMPPAKFSLNYNVQFKVANDVLTGVIELANFAHASDNGYHSYNIFVEERECSYTHVPEQDVLKKFS